MSYNILDLAVCPANCKLVAAASDKDRVFLYHIDGDVLSVVSVLVGLKSDGLSQTKVLWSPSSRVLYASSNDGALCCFDVVSGEVKRLTKHKAAIRNMACQQNMVATVSFDKTCCLWEREL